MFLNKMERKYGKYAISRLSMYIVFAYIIGYILQFCAKDALFLLTLDPNCILHAQVWRIVSWAIMPPYSLSIFTVINLFFIYSIGSTMERMWGDFRFNVYIFGGMLFCVIGAFLLYFIEYSTGIFGFGKTGIAEFSSILSTYFTTYYINVSMIMAFAMSVPESRVYLYFIIPIKMKYFAYVELFFIILDMIGGNILRRCVIVLSLLNFCIFYFSGRKAKVLGSSSAYNRARKKVKPQFSKSNASSVNSNSITRHKCAICGRTEESNPELEFRFCSKCHGNYEYCNEHLFTHTHVE